MKLILKPFILIIALIFVTSLFGADFFEALQYSNDAVQITSEEMKMLLSANETSGSDKKEQEVDTPEMKKLLQEMDTKGILEDEMDDLKSLKKEILEDPEGDDFKRDIQLLWKATQLIYSKYRKKVRSRKLVQTAINGMLDGLDPFSNFVPSKKEQDLEIKLKGTYGGLGIVISMVKGQLTIVSPIEDTPAERAGVLPLDEIMEIDGVSTKGITIDKAVDKMRGPAGEKCTIHVRRKKNKDFMKFDLIREIIKLKTVKTHYDEEKKLAYVRLTSFNQNTVPEMRKGLIEMMQKNPEGLILDLRSNPGGLLQGAVAVSNMFLEQNKLVVFTKGRIPSANAQHYTVQKPIVPDSPLVVLINQGSASASEIVSGAIKDHKRGLLVGETTFGKGSVQNVFPMFDKSNMILTVAHYYTPSGVCIHEKGIAPDVEIEQLTKEEFDKKKKEKSDRKGFWDAVHEQRDLEDAQENGLDGVTKEVTVTGETSEVKQTKKEEDPPESTEEMLERRKKLFKEAYKSDYQLQKAEQILKALIAIQNAKKN